MGETRTVRADDPARAELVRDGWTLVGESWGARLRIVDDAQLARLDAIVEAAAESGIRMRDMRPDEAESVAELDASSYADYPVTPATGHTAATPEALRATAGTGRVFVATVDGALAGVTAMGPADDRWETEYTSVGRDFRRRGIATALKAHAIRELVRDGVRVFGTGGAQVNEASRRMNEAVGYTIEESWISYRR